MNSEALQNLPVEMQQRLAQIMSQGSLSQGLPQVEAPVAPAPAPIVKPPSLMDHLIALRQEVAALRQETDASRQEMAQLASKEDYPFPYLYDESQQVAKDYQAACTPDLYLFDENILLKYRGQFDGSRPGNDTPVTGNDLKMAMDCLLNNKELAFTQKASLGCNIKWK